MQDHTTNESSVKLCECGCGNPAPIATKNDPRTGKIKGHPQRFILGHRAYLQPKVGRTPKPKKPKPSLAERFWMNVAKGNPNECWEWQGTRDQSAGYGRIGGNKIVYGAHRLSYELHHGPIPDGMCVCHTCDNRNCVNPSHLWIGTKGDNNRDAVAKKRNPAPKGERNHAAKLTEDDVRTIRTRYAKGEYQRVIADDYGIRASRISFIVNRKAWRHIE